MGEPDTSLGRTRSGTAITDELVERWVREAEAGYDSELRAAVEQRAERDDTTISEATREAPHNNIDPTS